MSSLRRGHANLLCIVPILTDDPRRESLMNYNTHMCVYTSRNKPRGSADAPVVAPVPLRAVQVPSALHWYIYIYIYIHIHIHIYIYIYIYLQRGGLKVVASQRGSSKNIYIYIYVIYIYAYIHNIHIYIYTHIRIQFIGWSNKHCDNLHVISSLEPNKQLRTCFKHATTIYVVMIWSRLLKR